MSIPQSVRRGLVVAVVIVAAIYQYFFNTGYQNSIPPKQPATTTSAASAASAAATASQAATVAKIQQVIAKQDFNAKFWVNLNGEVVKVLKDDREGDMHQRFLVQVAPNLTLLVAHNIDLAQRAPVQERQSVTLQGEYVWNDKGGVVHWTHRDPSGRKQGGWIEYQGKRYQ